MRGRTNITGGGMNLNAETKEFTVASGKSVVAGDFVSYYTTTSEKTLISAEFSTYDHKQIGNGLCLCQSNSILYLLNQTENGLEIVDAYNDYSVLDYEFLSDGSIVVCTKESPRLIRLNISDGKFQYVCSATGTPSSILEGSSYLYSIEYNQILYVFLPSTQMAATQTGTFSLSVYQYDVSQSGFMTYVKTISDKITTTAAWQFSTVASGRSERLYKPLVVGSYFCVPTRISWSSGSGTLVNSYITKFTLSNQGLEYVGEKNVSFGTGQRMEEFHGKYLLYANEQHIGLYNVRNDLVSLYNLNSFGFKDSKNGIKYSRVENNKIAIFFADVASYAAKGVERENGIFEVNSASGDIMLASNIFTPVFSIHGTYNTAVSNAIIYIEGILNDIVYNNGMECAHEVSYDPDAELLTEKANKNYVEPYTGGLAIGVAKQSGKSGQTIEVYVAKPSA